VKVSWLGNMSRRVTGDLNNKEREKLYIEKRTSRHWRQPKLKSPKKFKKLTKVPVGNQHPETRAARRGKLWPAQPLLQRLFCERKGFLQRNGAIRIC